MITGQNNIASLNLAAFKLTSWLAMTLRTWPDDIVQLS